MAKYLSNIDLNKNQLQNAALHPVATTPTTPVEGQVYFDTTVGDKMMYFYDGTSWVAMGSQGDITGVTAGTYLNGGGTSGNVAVNHDLTSRTDTTSSASPAFGGTFTAVDSVTSNSTGHVTAINLKTVTLPTPSAYSFNAAGDTGTPQPITSGDTLTIAGSIGIDTVAGATDTVTVNLDLTELNTATTLSTSTDYIVISDNGANGKILPGNITLDQWGDAAADVDFGGNKLLDVATGTAGTDGVNLAQVQSLVAGVGVFQGGYNATTNSPALTGASNVALNQGDFFVVTTGGTFFTETVEVGDLIFANSDIPASSSPSLSDYTVVIADQNIAGAGSTDGGTQKGVAGFYNGDFSVTANGFVTISNVNLGTQTTGNYVATITEGTGIDVTGSGTESAAVQVTLDLNELTATTTPTHLAGNDGSGNTRKFTIANIATEISSANSFAGLIGGSTSIGITSGTHGLGTDSSAFMVQLVEVSTGATVYADVTRGASGLVTIDFAVAPGANSIRVLIQKIG